jgi:hypothetical protein
VVQSEKLSWRNRKAGLSLLLHLEVLRAQRRAETLNGRRSFTSVGPSGRRPSCLACCLTAPEAARSDYRRDFASRFLIGYSCCARAAPSRHSPRRSEAEHKALRARLRCRDRLVPREVGQVRPNRPPPIDFRLVNRAGYLPLIRPDDQAEQIVKSEGGAALKFAEYPTYSH